MSTTVARITVRKGNDADLDVTKLLPGEFAFSADLRYLYICAAPGTVIQVATGEALQTYVDLCSQYATAAQTSATNSDISAIASNTKAVLSESYAIGGTNTRTGEDTDNSKYYKEQCDAVNQEMQSAIETIEPDVEYDFATGHLLYTDSVLVLQLNEETGHVSWGIGV